jgi:hypothetical protein
VAEAVVRDQKQLLQKMVVVRLAAVGQETVNYFLPLVCLVQLQLLLALVV